MCIEKLKFLKKINRLCEATSGGGNIDELVVLQSVACIQSSKDGPVAALKEMCRLRVYIQTKELCFCSIVDPYCYGSDPKHL